MDEEVLSWRSFRPLFEEEGIVNQRAPTFAYRFRDGSTLAIAQDPRLAARLAPNAEGSSGGGEEVSGAPFPLTNVDAGTLGSATEATSVTGAVVWDSSVVVCRLLEAGVAAGDRRRNRPGNSGTGCGKEKSSMNISEDCEWFEWFDVRDGGGVDVVELGAGCGLVSCCAWRLGAASVTATERPELIGLLGANIDANCGASSGGGGSGYDGRARSGDETVQVRAPPAVEAHMWGGPLPPWAPSSDIGLVGGRGDGERDGSGDDSDQGDDCGNGSGNGSASQGGRRRLLVLAVDCIYDEGAVAPLLTSIAALLRRGARAGAGPSEASGASGASGGSSASGGSRAGGCGSNGGSGVSRVGGGWAAEARPRCALVAVDRSYRRPVALAAFEAALAGFGLKAAEVHLAGGTGGGGGGSGGGGGGGGGCLLLPPADFRESVRVLRVTLLR